MTLVFRLFLFVLCTILIVPLSHAMTVKDFLERLDGDSVLDKALTNSYWQGVLDVTMYDMAHQYIQFDIKTRRGRLIEEKLCLPGEYPNSEQFLTSYRKFLNLQIKLKGKEAIENMLVEQTMLQFWYALFNCRMPP